MKTITISPAAYDEALAFCNARRKDLGLEPNLTELPPGRPLNNVSCPCAKTCEGKIKVDFWKWWFLKDENEIGGVPWEKERLDNRPQKFVQEFDRAHSFANGEEVLPIRGEV